MQLQHLQGQNIDLQVRYVKRTEAALTSRIQDQRSIFFMQLSGNVIYMTRIKIAVMPNNLTIQCSTAYVLILV